MSYSRVPLPYLTDSYKYSHFAMYPSGMTWMSAYAEARAGGLFADSVFFGLQYILQQHLEGERVIASDLAAFAQCVQTHGLPFNTTGFERIVNHHSGRLPIKIRAVPEGMVVPEGNVLFRVESTDSELAWLPTWIETILLQVWYPTTIATRGRYLRKVIYDALAKSSDNPDSEIPFKLHDFGFRGASCVEAAMIGGAAHGIHFQGSDTFAANWLINHHYGNPVAFLSITPMEHSTVLTWGRAGEVSAYERAISEYLKPGTLLAVVVDSYDMDVAVDTLIGQALRQTIIESGGILVIRPDSGDPVEVVLSALNSLEHSFGVTTNTKGYKVLKHVRVIQGDGVDEKSIPKILKAVLSAGFSAENIAFGMGAALLQGKPETPLNRDTLRFAYKPSMAEVDGHLRPLRKTPKTDPTKNSKRGILELVRLADGSFKTVDLSAESMPAGAESLMRDVFLNGEVLVRDDFDTIRARALAVT